MPRRVLLVDDDIAEISAVKRVLSRAGFQPVLATNASDALIAVTHDLPEMVLVAPSCENGEGLTLARKLREDGETARLPMILLGEVKEGPSAVAQLPRPVDPMLLLEELRTALKEPPVPRPARDSSEEPTVPRIDTAKLEADRKAAEGRAQQEIEKALVEAARRQEEADAATAAAQTRAREKEAPRAEVTRKSRVAKPGPNLLKLEQELEALQAEVKTEIASAPSREEWKPARAPRPSAAAPPQKAAEDDAAAAREAEEAAEREAKAAAREAKAAADREAKREAKAAAEREAMAAAEAELKQLQREAEAEKRARAKAEEALESAARADEDARLQLQEELRSLNEELREMQAQRQRDATEVSRLKKELDARARSKAELIEDLAQRAKAAEHAKESAAPEADAEQERDEAAARKRVLTIARHRKAVAQGAEPWVVGGEHRIDPGAELEELEHLPEPTVPGEEKAKPPPSGVPAALAQGDLEDMPAPRILAAAAKAALTARIDFEVPGTNRTVWVEEGRVVGVLSNEPHERVDAVALRLGILTPEQHQRVAPALAGMTARRGAVLLLERGFIKPGELAGLIRRRTEEVVFSLFAEVEGSFRSSAVRVPTEERVALTRGTSALIVEGVRRKWLAPQIDAILGGAGTLLAPVEGGPQLHALGLNPEESLLLSQADGLHPLEELVDGSGIEPLAARRCLAGLVLAGTLGVRVSDPVEARQEPDRGIDLARVQAKASQVQRSDYFSILGLRRDCTTPEVEEAAKRLLTEYDPRRFGGANGATEALTEIQRVLKEAQEILSDQDLRADYAAGLGD